MIKGHRVVGDSGTTDFQPGIYNDGEYDISFDNVAVMECGLKLKFPHPVRLDEWLWCHRCREWQLPKIAEGHPKVECVDCNREYRVSATVDTHTVMNQHRRTPKGRNHLMRFGRMDRTGTFVWSLYGL